MNIQVGPPPFGLSKNPIKGNPVLSRSLYLDRTALELRPFYIEILTARVDVARFVASLRDSTFLQSILRVKIKFARRVRRYSEVSEFLCDK